MLLENKKTFALRIEHIRIEHFETTRKPYVNNAPDMRNAQMNDALVKAHDSKLARLAFKKIANQKESGRKKNPLHWNHNFF